MIKKNKWLTICLCILFLLVICHILYVYNHISNHYSHTTKFKLEALYHGILIYVQEYNKYPSSLDLLLKKEIVNEQKIYDIKIINPFTAIFSKAKIKKLPFLYNSCLISYPPNDSNLIIVAEPVPIDNMRFVIYNKYINLLLNNPNSKHAFDEAWQKSAFSIKRISEFKFQKQIKNKFH